MEIVKIKEEEEVKLDETGRLVHDDSINFRCSHKDIIFIHETIGLVLEKGLVPEPEIGPIMVLLDMLANAEPDTHKHGCFILPVNYFIGMWHGLNTARKFGLYSQQFKQKEKHLDHLTTQVARSIDAYHTIKSHVAEEEKLELTPKYFEKMNTEMLKALREN
jgi:hypothetical protein